MSKVLDEFMRDIRYSPSEEERIKQAFLEHGVSARFEKDLVLLKYGLTPDWDKEIAQHCRGAIFRHKGSQWSRVTRPFSKFFNMSEGRCPLFGTKDLEGYELREKADGTCIQVWFDDVRGDWRCSTLGTITTQEINPGLPTFGSLFWRFFEVQGLFQLDRDRTWLFELCTPENRVVSEYEQPLVFSLGSVDVNSGEHFAPQSLGKARVPRYERAPKGVLGRDAALLVSDGHYVKIPEGCVVVDEFNRPIAKIKLDEYLALHRVGGGESTAAVVNQLVKCLAEGVSDDVRQVLGPQRLVGLEAMERACRELIARATIELAQLSSPLFKPENRKEYAAAVKSIVTNPVTSNFAFRNADKFMQGQLFSASTFESFFFENISKNEDILKDAFYEAYNKA